MGAFAGAYAAQRTAERSKARDLLIAEMRGTNAAITAAFSIFNIAIRFMRLHVKELYDEFESERSRFVEYKRMIENGEISPSVGFFTKSDMRQLHAPLIDTEVLQTQIYDRISVSGRSLALVSYMKGAQAAIEELVGRRNNLVDAFKAQLSTPDGVLRPEAYYGMPLNGEIDGRYSDALAGINSHTNDLIFFSEMLCADLMEYGRQLQNRPAAANLKLKLNCVNLEDARKAGFIPPTEPYAEFLEAFASTNPPNPKSRIAKILDWLHVRH